MHRGCEDIAREQHQCKIIQVAYFHSMGCYDSLLPTNSMNKLRNQPRTWVGGILLIELVRVVTELNF